MVNRSPEILEQVKEIHSHISCFIRTTPLHRFKELEHLLSLPYPVFLKCEQFQITESFKLRGVSNALLKLTQEQRKRGVVSRSSGNFGQALAYLTKKMGIKCTLVLPENIPQIKLEKTQQYQPEIFLHGISHKEMDEKVAELVSRYHYVQLKPFDHHDVILGQATIAFEILETNPYIQNLIIPLGGGGLSAGVASYFKAKNPEGKVIVVEPEGASDFFQSLQKGKKITLESTDTIADGLRAPSVGNLNWPILKECVDEALLVSDQEIVEAMKALHHYLHFKIEPSGAAGVAALMRYGSKLNLDGSTALILSGGNISDKDFFELIENFAPSS